MAKKSNKQDTTFNFTANHPQCDEIFLRERSKVDEAIEFLDMMANANKMEEQEGKKNEVKPVVDISADVTDDNFYTKLRSQSERFSAIRSQHMRSSTKRIKGKKQTANINEFTFMRQIDQSEEQRIQVLKERELVANSFRRLGNSWYRKDQYKTAVEMYTKGLNYIHDTPVLYINRACCFIKMRNFKRAIMDCDYIIRVLDPIYVRAWLYRAGAYKRLNDEKNYEESIYQAKRLNFKEHEFIDNFLEKMRTSF